MSKRVYRGKMMIPPEPLQGAVASSSPRHSRTHTSITNVSSNAAREVGRCTYYLNTRRRLRNQKFRKLLRRADIHVAHAAAATVPNAATSPIDLDAVARSVSSMGKKLKMELLDREIELPINGYELVGLMSHYTSDRIGRELQLRLEDDLSEDNFSSSTMMGRAQFLNEIISVMTDPILRLQYDEELFYGCGEWYISRDKLSGVLALLLVRRSCFCRSSNIVIGSDNQYQSYYH